MAKRSSRFNIGVCLEMSGPRIYWFPIFPGFPCKSIISRNPWRRQTNNQRIELSFVNHSPRYVAFPLWPGAPDRKRTVNSLKLWELLLLVPATLTMNGSYPAILADCGVFDGVEGSKDCCVQIHKYHIEDL